MIDYLGDAEDQFLFNIENNSYKM